MCSETKPKHTWLALKWHPELSMQSALLSLNGLQLEHLATSPICLLWNHQMVVVGMSTTGHYLLHGELLLVSHSKPSDCQVSWTQSLGPPENFHIPHNGLENPLSLDIQSMKLSEFFKNIMASEIKVLIWRGGGFQDETKPKSLSTLTYKFTFHNSKYI